MAAAAAVYACRHYCTKEPRTTTVNVTRPTDAILFCQKLPTRRGLRVRSCLSIYVCLTTPPSNGGNGRYSNSKSINEMIIRSIRSFFELKNDENMYLFIDHTALLFFQFFFLLLLFSSAFYDHWKCRLQPTLSEVL